MATLTQLPAACTIEMTSLRPHSNAGMGHSLAPLAKAAPQTPVAPAPDTAAPAFLQSAARRRGQAASGLLQAPVLLTRTGQTVDKAEAGSKKHVPNKALAEALALYTASDVSIADQDNWHDLLDPITLQAPVFAVQVASKYKNTSRTTGASETYQEHAIFDVDSLVQWFAVQRVSPASRGRIVYPIQIVPNIAVSNLVRAFSTPQKPPLTLQQQHMFVDYCKDVSSFLSASNGYVKPRSTATKILAPLTVLSGVATLVGLRFAKNLVPTPNMPTAPRPSDCAADSYDNWQRFYYGFEAIYGDDGDSYVPVPVKNQYALGGCEPAKDACSYIDMVGNFETASRERQYDQSRSYTDTMFGGQDLINLCLQRQASCVTDSNACKAQSALYTTQRDAYQVALNTYHGAVHHQHTVYSSLDGAAAAAFLLALGAAGCLWSVGKRTAPGMPKMMMTSDDV